MSDDKLWYIEGKPLPYKLHSIDLSPNRYDMHGDILWTGGVEIGNFVRVTPSGKGKWARRDMASMIAYNTK
jgi:hypothetical protein